MKNKSFMGIFPEYCRQSFQELLPLMYVRNISRQADIFLLAESLSKNANGILQTSCFKLPLIFINDPVLSGILSSKGTFLEL